MAIPNENEMGIWDDSRFSSDLLQRAKGGKPVQIQNVLSTIFEENMTYDCGQESRLVKGSCIVCSSRWEFHSWTNTRFKLPVLSKILADGITSSTCKLRSQARTHLPPWDLGCKLRKVSQWTRKELKAFRLSSLKPPSSLLKFCGTPP